MAHDRELSNSPGSLMDTEGSHTQSLRILQSLRVPLTVPEGPSHPLRVRVKSISRKQDSKLKSVWDQGGATVSPVGNKEETGN